MPIDYAKYPKNFKTEIRPRILERAGHKCEWCGVPNYARVWRHPSEDLPNVFTTDIEQAALWYQDTAASGSKICLTIAHIIDPDPMNCADDNLRALCNSCHLRHDAKMHAMNAIRNKNKELELAGQLRLF